MTNSLNILQDNVPWYSQGLRFKCTECGKCCTGAPGYTWVSDAEIVDIASHLGLSLDEFGKKYLRLVNGKYALLEKPASYDCIFLKDKKCEIYQLRPMQCRTFPWWKQNLSSPEEWQEAAQYCEGISSEAPLVPLHDIQENLSINVLD
jgi:uncharacterized protein